MLLNLYSAQKVEANYPNLLTLALIPTLHYFSFQSSYISGRDSCTLIHYNRYLNRTSASVTTVFYSVVALLASAFSLFIECC